VKRFLIVTTLTCALSVSAMAGEIPTSGSPTPAPSGTTQTTTTTSPSDIPTDGSAEQVSDTALSTLLTVLGFLAV
jgi:hypothetical protein